MVGYSKWQHTGKLLTYFRWNVLYVQWTHSFISSLYTIEIIVSKYRYKRVKVTFFTEKDDAPCRKYITRI